MYRYGDVYIDNDPVNSFWENRGYILSTNLNYRNKNLNENIPAGDQEY